MSMIKRYLDDEVEKFADKYTVPWDYVMDMAIFYNFDLEKTEAYLAKRFSSK